MSIAKLGISFDAHDPRKLAEFWGRLPAGCGTQQARWPGSASSRACGDSPRSRRRCRCGPLV